MADGELDYHQPVQLTEAGSIPAGHPSVLASRMGDAMTLRELYEQHPEWHDHELAVLATNGELDYVDGSAALYEGEDVLTMTSETDPTPKIVKVLVLAGN